MLFIYWYNNLCAVFVVEEIEKGIVSGSELDEYLFLSVCVKIDLY